MAKVSTRVIHFRCLLFAFHAWSNMEEKLHLDIEDFSEEQFMESFLKEIQSEEAVFIIGIFVALALVILTIGKKQLYCQMASIKRHIRASIHTRHIFWNSSAELLLLLLLFMFTASRYTCLKYIRCYTEIFEAFARIQIKINELLYEQEVSITDGLTHTGI